MNTEFALPEEWNELLTQTARFKKLKAWEWMDDDHLIGVQNPETGEIGYCVVMGKIGEVFGLAVYLGDVGLDNIRRIKDFDDSLQLQFEQRCITVTFEDRKELDKQDYQLIKGLGLSFRGRKEWPMFRSYLPGYYPWYLGREEVRFLTIALEQIIILAEQILHDPEYLNTSLDNIYVRTPVEGQEVLEWQESWVTPKFVKDETSDNMLLDTVRLQRIKKDTVVRDMLWEVDAFYLPSPVQDNREERPYYPLAFMCISTDTGQILNFNMLDKDSYLANSVDQWLCTIENVKAVPRMIVVQNESLYQILKTVGDKIGCHVKLVDELQILEYVKYDMLDNLW